MNSIEALGANSIDIGNTLDLASPKPWGTDSVESGFSGAFGKALNMLVQPQQDATRTVNEFAQGADGELHKSMLTLERADISLKFAVSLRNKCLEAYREIMHMGS
jgi:flagellar hook-basal body complex protein FliE